MSSADMRPTNLGQGDWMSCPITDLRTVLKRLDVRNSVSKSGHAASKLGKTSGTTTTGSENIDSKENQKRHQNGMTLHKINLKNHVEKSYKCMFCFKSCNSSDNLERHMRVHTGERPYTCPNCPKSFAASWNMKRHELTHVGENPLKCHICLKTFSQADHLKAHMNLHSKEGGKYYTCLFCSKTFNLSEHLRRHLRIHTNEKPDLYVKSPKSISDSRTVKPSVTHTIEKSHTCQVCQETFSRAELDQHICLWTNDGEKRNTCMLCLKTFSRPSRLENYTRVHTKEKPFHCETCLKSFSDTLIL